MKNFIMMTIASSLVPWSAIGQTTTCTPTPDCEELGYTQSSCPDGNGIKCPWGDKWACLQNEEEVCKKYDFNYTCSGTGYAGGVGEDCGGKYVSCECEDGYIWSNGSCVEYRPWGKCSGIAASCKIGDILFSDGTCNTNTVSGKTPIAVVVYKSDDGKCGQAMGLEPKTNIAFCKNIVVPETCYRPDTGLPYPCYTVAMDLCSYRTIGGIVSSLTAASKDTQSCANTSKLESVDIVDYINEYETTGTKAGDWCLPAAGIITSIKNNQNIINTGFSRAGGTEFTNATYAWTSTSMQEGEMLYSDFSKTYGLNSSGNTSSKDLRPVIEF